MGCSECIATVSESVFDVIGSIELHPALNLMQAIFMVYLSEVLGSARVIGWEISVVRFKHGLNLGHDNGQ